MTVSLFQLPSPFALGAECRWDVVLERPLTQHWGIWKFQDGRLETPCTTPQLRRLVVALGGVRAIRSTDRQHVIGDASAFADSPEEQPIGDTAGEAAAREAPADAPRPGEQEPATSTPPQAGVAPTGGENRGTPKPKRRRRRK